MKAMGMSDTANSDSRSRFASKAAQPLRAGTFESSST